VEDAEDAEAVEDGDEELLCGQAQDASSPEGHGGGGGGAQVGGGAFPRLLSR